MPGGSSGFDALYAGGFLVNHGDAFLNLNIMGMWWTSTNSSPAAWNRAIITKYDSFERIRDTNLNGRSLRCLKN